MARQSYKRSIECQNFVHDSFELQDLSVIKENELIPWVLFSTKFYLSVFLVVLSLRE